MKNSNKIGLFVFFAIIILLISGCPTPFDTIQKINDNQDNRLTQLEARADAIETDLTGVHAWMITTDEQLAQAFEQIAENAGDIAQLRLDMQAGDTELQSQIDDIVELFWQKYEEIHNRIDAVVDQANTDRRAFRRGLLRAYAGLMRVNWRVSQLEDAFGEAAQDFQNQLDALASDLATAKAECIAAIGELQTQIDDINVSLDSKITLVQADMEMYRILFGDIAFDSEGNFKPYYRNQMYWNGIFQGYNRVVSGLLYQIAWGISHDSYTPPASAANAVVQALRDYYLTIESAEDMVDNLTDLIDALELDATSLAAIINALPEDPVNWAGVFATLGDVSGVEIGDMLYTVADSTLWIVKDNDGSLQLMSVARPGGTMYHNL